MPSPLTHAAAGAAIAHFLGGNHYAAAIAYALLPDIDHIFIWTKNTLTSRSPSLGLWDEDGLLGARTVLHEFPGLIVFSLLGLFVALTFSADHGKLIILGTVVHLFLDFATGASKPLRPFSNKMIDFRLPWKFRILEEMAIFVFFVSAWLY